MKTAKFAAAAGVIVIAGLILIFYRIRFGSQNIIKNNLKQMQLTSSAFENGEKIPVQYTCDADGISPPLFINNVPQEAKSLVLILDDPDAPVSGGFVHWVIFNMNPTTSEIKERSRPASGIEGTTSADQVGYVGPCPPSGAHHYRFKLYALDTMLSLDSSAKREDVEKAMDGHVIDQALLVGLYQRR